MTKYFLYARKSTEDEERQVMSIEAQIAELNEYAKRENIEIAKTFIESKSAKKPGREIFNEMMGAVHASREPVGLLAWHPDRLARNSIDGGQIIYLIDTEKLVSLRFPTFWFEPTPQGLFMLQVAFGQSKYYSDNLSENVKRGIRQKLRRGEWPTLAPFGYVNNPKTRNIEPNPVKAKIIRKVYELYAQGNIGLEELSKRLSFWGVSSRTGKLLSKAVIRKILSNPVYIGLIVHNGETFEGKFEPIVSRAAFSAVQKVQVIRSRKFKTRKSHDFPFCGLLKCGECGGSITAQWAKGNGGRYRYYRCTKKLGVCHQKYLREDLLLKQLKERLEKAALPASWPDEMLKICESWKEEAENSQASHAKQIKINIQTEKKRLDKLVNAYLDGTIEKDFYLKKKDEIIKHKTDLMEKKSALRGKGNNWLEPLTEWVSSLKHAQKLASSNDFMNIKSFAEKIGTNRRLAEKQVVWDWVCPYDKILFYKQKFPFVFSLSARGGVAAAPLSADERSVMSGCRELNPGYRTPSPA